MFRDNLKTYIYEHEHIYTDSNNRSIVTLIIHYEDESEHELRLIDVYNERIMFYSVFFTFFFF